MRSAGSNRDDTWARIRTAGVDLLYRYGYEAMNTRQLAEASGLKSGSLYYYFKSKEDFLHRLLIDLLSEIVADLESALDGVEDVEEQLETFVRILVKWHVERREETFIASIEIRSLSQERHESYMELRDRFDSTLQAILEKGVAQGSFSIAHEPIARNAILSSMTAISNWYDRKGSVSPREVADDFVVLVRRMVGCPA